MIHFINYADEKFLRKQKLNAISAKIFGKADIVKSYNIKDVSPEFYEYNKATFECERGGGYWLWKPYIILKHLETIEFNDYLFYCDSGSVIIRSLKSIKKIMEDDGKDIMLFDLPLLEFQWTKKKVFESLGCEDEHFKNTNQIMSGYIFIKKTDFSINFFKKYLELCLRVDNLNDSENVGINDKYLAHRHDQSILSLWAKKNGIEPYRDPSDYGDFPEKYLSPGRFFLIKDKKNKFKTFILATRKENTLLYLLKYLIRKIIKVFIKS